MLDFILGRASSGKTYETVKRITECAKKGGNPILVVPEQYSFESERAILKALGDSDASKVSVLPFSRLYDTIGRIKGGICGKTLTKSDKLILMSRAIREVSKELKLWGRYAHSSSFAEGMISIADDFKQNSVTTNDLLLTAERQTNQKLSDKIFDTVKIIDAYDMSLGTSFIDPSDILDKLYYMLEDCDYFCGKQVFFDGFRGFSGQQLKIIERIIGKAENVTFAFIDDLSDTRQFGILRNIRITRDKIEKIAESENIKIGAVTVLNESRYFDDGMKAFENCVFTGTYNYKDKINSVTVCECETVFDEVSFVARNIRRIIREENAKFSDFVIIARDTKDYEDSLAVACEKNEIKCFIDKKYPLSSTPVATTVLSAISFAEKPETKNIFRFHKSGINMLSTAELSKLENYSYIWNIKAKDFLCDFTMNPLGFTDKTDESIDDELKEINDLRRCVIQPLETFRKEYKGTAKNRITAIINLLDYCNLKEAYKNIFNEYEQNGDIYYSSLLKESYKEFINVLDCICRCFPDINISDTEFKEALNSALTLSNIGLTPQTLDEVTFGSADRIRPARPKYAFIMGLNQGIFPKTVKEKGLFSVAELNVLKESGLNIPDTVIDFAIDEELLIYTNLCCASNKVFLSYTNMSADGASREKSSFLEEIISNLDVNKCFFPDELSNFSLPETKIGAFDDYCLSKGRNAEKEKTLFLSLEDTEYADFADRILNNLTAENARISPETAKKLYGKRIFMSPTRFDNYNRCKFMFFLKNGLGAAKLYPADFNVMQKGTMVHYVLQRIIEIYGKDVSKLDDAKISSEVERLCDEYLAGIVGYKNIESVHSKYIVSTMIKTLKYVVKRLALEFSQSDFEPQRCELLIGKDGEIPEITVDLNDNSSLSLGGVIDRLDTYKNYVRIVDYKTGSRNFRLPDVLFGQNMQMLLYLYSVIKSGKFGDAPAGILYMSAKRVKEGKPADRRMNGLITADSDLVYAMDKENKGEFVPRFKDDNPSDSYISSEDFKKVFDFIEKKLKTVGEDIFKGEISAKPIDGIDSPACKYCDFYSVCRIDNATIKSVPKISNCEVIKFMKNGGNINEAD